MAFTSLILCGGRTTTENVFFFLAGCRCLGGYGSDMCTWLLCVNSSANMRVRAREREYVHASSCACLISLRGMKCLFF